MIDDKATKERFGYSVENIMPGSGKRIVYFCSSCGRVSQRQRRHYKEGQLCIECARSKRKIGQPAIKEDILRVAKMLGHQPTSREYKKLGKYSISAVMANFGKGWREILSSIGLKVQRRQNDSYSYEEVSKELIAVKTKLGFVPTIEQYLEIGKISLAAIRYTTKCKRWVDIIEKVLGVSKEEGNFYRAGGYKTTKQHLTKLKEIANNLGHTPSRTQADQAGLKTRELIKRLNTNWLGVLQAANLDPKTLPKGSAVLFATKEDMIKDLCRVAKLIGKPPKSNDYKLHGKYALQTVSSRLGNWQEALKAAGLDLESRYHNKKDNIVRPTDYYLQRLRELAEKLGRAPSGAEASKYGIRIARLYKRLKTDWAGILKIAGINYLSLPSKSLMHYVSNDEMLEDISRVTSLIGHKPNLAEYSKHGIYSASTVKRRFGDSWSSVLDKIHLDSIINTVVCVKLSVSNPNNIYLHNSSDQDSVNNVKKFFDKQKFLSKPKE
jgi:hypothetical protein